LAVGQVPEFTKSVRTPALCVPFIITAHACWPPAAIVAVLVRPFTTTGVDESVVVALPN
jgi:hypothetical protein